MSYQRTTDKYIKIKREGDKAPEHEIRIRAAPRIGRYISYAAKLLLEEKLDFVIIKASGVATKGAVQVAEILRHRILGLHQVTLLKTNSVIDEYEPQEEGLDRVKVERKLAVLEITLSLKESVVDTKSVGYQAPLPKDQVSEEDLKTLIGGRRAGSERREGGRDEGRREGGRDEGRREVRGEGRGGFRRGRYAGERGRGGFRGGRGGYGGNRDREGGYQGNRDREGGYQGNRDREGGYQGNRDREGGYQGNRDREGGYQGNRDREGGYQGNRDREGGYQGNRDREGGYQGNRGSYGGNRGSYGGNRGSYGGNRGSYRGSRGDHRE